MKNSGHVARSIAKWLGIVVGGLVVVVVLGFLIVPPVTRGWTDRWGATAAEVGSSLPGDSLVSTPTAVSTRAISINAPAELVYALVIQMGYRRAGWYGWDWFYNATGSDSFIDGHYSTRVVPQLQNVKLGDRIYINKQVGYGVVENVHPTTGTPGVFVLFGATGPDGKPAPPPGDPRRDTLMSWVWYVRPIDATHTRLILRLRSGGASLGPFLDWLLNNPLDFGGALFARKTLVGIKSTAEALTTSGAGPP